MACINIIQKDFVAALAEGFNFEHYKQSCDFLASIFLETGTALAYTMHQVGQRSVIPMRSKNVSHGSAEFRHM